MKQIKWSLAVVAIVGTLSAFTTSKFAGETVVKNPSNPSQYIIPSGTRGINWTCNAASDQCTYTVNQGVNHPAPFTASEVTAVPADANKTYVRLTP